jgi:ketosteroid isomerase-like protein
MRESHRSTSVQADLPAVIQDHIAAVNAGDLDALMATFADDAFVTAQAEARGADAVRGLLAREFIDDHVRLEVRDVVDHHGDFIVRTKYDTDDFTLLGPSKDRRARGG